VVPFLPGAAVICRVVFYRRFAEATAKKNGPKRFFQGCKGEEEAPGARVLNGAHVRQAKFCKETARQIKRPLLCIY
jgi:hypothetical protein